MLEADLKANDVNAEVEIYPDAHHKFAFPERPAFQKKFAERHWARLHALFARICWGGEARIDRDQATSPRMAHR